jgi:hypothetical protein
MVPKGRDKESLWRILAQHEGHIECVKSRAVASRDILTFSLKLKARSRRLEAGEGRIASVLASRSVRERFPAMAGTSITITTTILAPSAPYLIFRNFLRLSRV